MGSYAQASGALRHCPSCGRGNRPDRSFCGGCATQIAAFCSTCRFANDLDDTFCGGCARALQARAEDDDIPMTIEAPRPVTQPVAAARVTGAFQVAPPTDELKNRLLSLNRAYVNNAAPVEEEEELDLGQDQIDDLFD